MSEGVDAPLNEHGLSPTGRAEIVNEVRQVLARLQLNHSEAAGLVFPETGLAQDVEIELANLAETAKNKVSLGDLVYRVISYRLYQGCNSGQEDLKEAAFQAIFELIYRYIWKKTSPQRPLAEDLTNDTLLKIIEKLDTCRSPYFFLKWAEQIAYHNVAQHFREQAKAPVLEQVSREVNFDPEEEAAMAVAASPEEAILSQEQRRLLLEKIAGMKTTTRRARDYKAILIGTYFSGLTDLELAAKLKLKPQEIQKRRYQALRLLRSDQNWLDQLK